MLKVEYPWNDRVDRIRHYSDENKMIRQKDTGNLYEDAVDIYPTDRTYEETDIPIPTPEEMEEPQNELRENRSR